MKTRPRNGLARAALCSCLTLCTSGCRDHAGEISATSARVGALTLDLLVPRHSELRTVEYSIEGPTVATGYLSAEAIHHDGSLWSTRLMLPAGFGYKVSLHAQQPGTTDCSGTASFDVPPGVTTTLHLGLGCTQDNGPEPQAKKRSATSNTCPFLEYVAATPRGGGKVDLLAIGSDADNGPRELSYRWSVPTDIGTIGDPNAAGTTFSCTAAGDVSLFVEITDGECGDKAQAYVECPDTTLLMAGASGDWALSTHRQAESWSAHTTLRPPAGPL